MSALDQRSQGSQPDIEEERQRIKPEKPAAKHIPKNPPVKPGQVQLTETIKNLMAGDLKQIKLH